MKYVGFEFLKDFGEKRLVSTFSVLANQPTVHSGGDGRGEVSVGCCFGSGHCEHPAHSCVVGCKERGGDLTYGDSLNSSGNDNNAFVCCAGHS